MALDALLARLEGRAVTPVTDGAIADVTPKPATILASTPLTFSSVTCVTSVTSKNDDTAREATGEPIPGPAMEARRQRVLAMLRDSPTITYAVVTDTDSDPDAVIVAMAIRGKASFELLIPRAKWDGVLFIDLLDKHCGTVH